MDETVTTPYRLGRLQKAILSIALHREAEGRSGQDDCGADVLSTEAIVVHLDLPDIEESLSGRRLYSATVYSPARLSKAEYLSAKGSVSVSLRILERRGLVVPVRGVTGWSGANLTAEGVRVAQSLREMELVRQPGAC